MKKCNHLLLILAAIVASSTNLRAESGIVDFLASTGKIYSVIAVIVVVLLGIGFFLYRIDNKLTKLENQINNEQ